MIAPLPGHRLRGAKALPQPQPRESSDPLAVLQEKFAALQARHSEIVEASTKAIAVLEAEAKELRERLADSTKQLEQRTNALASANRKIAKLEADRAELRKQPTAETPK